MIEVIRSIYVKLHQFMCSNVANNDERLQQLI
jgi:hypothetical protein